MGQMRILVTALSLTMAVASSKAHAAAEYYGDWSVEQFSNTLAMATVNNNAGSVFGVMCDQSSCEAFLNPKIPCTDGNLYPALVNAPSAAFAVTIKCVKVDTFFVFAFPLEGGVADAMSVGGVIGIAFPMKSGEFEVSRFSLTGSARASARAGQMVQRAAPPKIQLQPSDHYKL